jgi:hypothetical protein
MAKEHYRAGELCFDNNLFGASTTRSYYAAYQGMWVALGAPPLGRWRHHGLIQQFCFGLTLARETLAFIAQAKGLIFP